MSATEKNYICTRSAAIDTSPARTTTGGQAKTRSTTKATTTRGGSDNDGDDAVIEKKRLDTIEGQLNRRLKALTEAPMMIDISAAKRNTTL